MTSDHAGLKTSLQEWVETSIAEMTAQSEDGTAPRVSVDASANGFIEQWKGAGGEMSYGFEVKDTILMANEQYLSVRLDMYVNSGGAHPNYFTKLAVFDVKTGTIVPKPAYINNEKDILPLLDIAYRAEKKEAFDEGMQYMDGNIVFPVQCAFTEKGVLFHYNIYEIAPYAMGDADIFMTWIDLGQSAANPLETKPSVQ